MIDYEILAISRAMDRSADLIESSHHKPVFVSPGIDKARVEFLRRMSQVVREWFDETSDDDIL